MRPCMEPHRARPIHLAGPCMAIAFLAAAAAAEDWPGWRLCARGVAEIGFQVVVGNLDAIAFYEAMGARPVGRKLEGEGDSAWEDVVFALATAGLTAAKAGR